MTSIRWRSLAILCLVVICGSLLLPASQAANQAKASYALVDIHRVGFERLESIKSTAGISWWVELDDQLLIYATPSAIRHLGRSNRVTTLEETADPSELRFLYRSHGDDLDGGSIRVLGRGGNAAVVIGTLPPHKHGDEEVNDAHAMIAPFFPNAVLASQAANSPRTSVSEFDVSIQTLVDSVDGNRWFNDVSSLAGFNRYTRGSGIAAARDWLVQQFQAIPGLTVETQSFSVPGSPATTAFNVIATLPGTTRPNELPHEAEETILRALAFDAADRHSSARELGDDLGAMLAGIESRGSGTVRGAGSPTGRAQFETRMGTKPAGSMSPVAETIIDMSQTSRSALGQTLKVEPRELVPPQPLGVVTVADTVKAPLPPRSSFKPIAIVLSLVIVGVIAFISLLYAMRSTLAPAPSPPTPAPTPAPPAPVESREFTYSITVQKYRDGQPFQQPFDLASEINFEKDYRVRLNLESGQAGHLYVINEAPGVPGGDSELVLLFPSTQSHGGASLLSPSQGVKIPEASWFAFDGQQGTEKVWLIWAGSPIPEFEALGPANPAALGAITNVEQVAAVRAFLTSHAADGPQITRDDARKRTTIRSPGTVLVHLLRLEHH